MHLALQNGANPFWRNGHGDNALVMARTWKMQNELAAAIRFVPELRVARWYGPYFQRRAWEFLLCNHRCWRLGRDLRLMIVRMLAEMESV